MRRCLAGGNLIVSSGAVTTGTMVSDGGNVYVFSGAVAANTVLNGGYELAYAGSTVSGATISGGALELQNGVNGASTFDFASGGMLTLDGTRTYNILVAGFTSPTAEIDLKSVNYARATVSFAEASNNISGTLTISDGTNSASILLLGNYVAGAASFTLSKDSGTGTVVYDPLQMVEMAQSLLAAPPNKA